MENVDGMWYAWPSKHRTNRRCVNGYFHQNFLVRQGQWTMYDCSDTYMSICVLRVDGSGEKKTGSGEIRESF